MGERPGTAGYAFGQHIRKRIEEVFAWDHARSPGKRRPGSLIWERQAIERTLCAADGPPSSARTDERLLAKPKLKAKDFCVRQALVLDPAPHRHRSNLA
jgi:hypothetical protein